MAQGSDSIVVTTPPCRVVAGSLYVPNETDSKGNRLTIKSGPNIGQPRVEYFFAVAIPKVPGQTHWAMKPATWDQEQVQLGRPGFPHWGEQIWAKGHQEFIQAAKNEDFSWKIVDGDSTKPGKVFRGKQGRPPCENEGWPGHWVIKMKNGFAPKIYKSEGAGYVQVMEKDFIKPGYWVEVNFQTRRNDGESPGLYHNPGMVLFRAYGQEIVFGPDVESAGFSNAPLPPGASMTPAASAMPPPGAMPLPAQAQVPIPVLPNPGFVQVPPPVPTVPGAASAAPGYPPPPSSVPASASSATTSPSKTMTPKANGLTYEAYIGSGWTDELLIQHGLMLA